MNLQQLCNTINIKKFIIIIIILYYLLLVRFIVYYHIKPHIPL